MNAIFKTITIDAIVSGVGTCACAVARRRVEAGARYRKLGLRDGKGCGTNGLWIGRLLFGKLCERE